MKIFVRLLLVACLLYGTGTHWALLQGAAWAGMKAIGQTVPCRVCKLVAKASVLPA